MNAITALSGSGPAFQYLIMEIVRGCGGASGIASRHLALTLVAQTAVGADRRWCRRRVGIRRRLRDDVTTPAGCKIGGLLDVGGWEDSECAGSGD